MEVNEEELQKLEINDYISVNCLIELKKHGQQVSFAENELCYLMPKSILEKYNSYKCKCGENCAFSCVACYLDESQTIPQHSVCLKKLDHDPTFFLECLQCYEKNKKGKSKKPKTIIEDESEEREEKKKKDKENQQKSIRRRMCPEVFLTIFDHVLVSLGAKKLNREILVYILDNE